MRHKVQILFIVQKSVTYFPSLKSDISSYDFCVYLLRKELRKRFFNLEFIPGGDRQYKSSAHFPVLLPVNRVCVHMPYTSIDYCKSTRTCRVFATILHIEALVANSERIGRSYKLILFTHLNLVTNI